MCAYIRGLGPDGPGRGGGRGDGEDVSQLCQTVTQQSQSDKDSYQAEHSEKRPMPFRVYAIHVSFGVSLSGRCL